MTFEQVLHGVPGVDAEVVGLSQHPGHCVASVQVAQSQDLAHVVEVVGMVQSQIGKPDGGHWVQGLEGELFGGDLTAAVEFDEFALVLGIDDLLVAVVAAWMGGDELALMIKIELVVVAVEGDLLLRTDRRDAVAVGFAMDTAAVGDAHGDGLPGVAVVGIEGKHGGLVGRKDIAGAGVQFPVLADVRSVFQPLTRLRVEAFQGRIGRQCVQIAAVEKVAFDISDVAFHATFFVGAARRAGDRTGAKMAAKVLEAGIEDRRTPEAVFDDGGLHIIDDEAVGNALKAGEGVGQPGKNVLQAFLQEAFDVELAGVTEHHAQEAQAASGAPDLQAFVRAPIHLSSLPGGKVQGLVGAVLPWPDQPHILAQDAASATVAGFFQLLINLHRGEVCLFDPVLDGAFEWLQLVRAWRGSSAPVFLFFQPAAHGLFIEPDFQGDLGAGMALVDTLQDPAVGGVVDHGRVRSGTRRKSRKLSMHPARCRESPFMGSSVRSW